MQAQSPTDRILGELPNLVGRGDDVRQVRQLLATARWVTLTGVGGGGKTSVALQVGRESQPTFADGVCLVDLAVVSDGTLLGCQVAEALGIGVSDDSDIVHVVRSFLEDRELLLILDNCEHLLEASAEFVDQTLRRAANVRVLATSRQPFGVVGEHIYPVSPLPVPEPEQPAAGDDDGPAVVLFAERAVAASPRFAVTPENRDSVVEICRRLDGLPLAIELAAARLRTLSIDELEVGLRERLGLLSARHPVPARHRTMESTFDWSLALCSPTERLLWTRLSVFVGGFELAAAEHVVGYHDLPAADVADAVAGLVDKSVLARDQHCGQVRYRLPETARQYGRDRLRAADGTGGLPEAQLRHRHRDYYLDLAERFDADWFGPRQAQWARRMRADLGNLRAALSYCLSTPGEASAGICLAGALSYFWSACGAVHEGSYWLDRALAADQDPGTARLRALAASCWLLVVQGEHTAAADRAGECLRQAEQLGEPRYVARALADLGTTHLYSNDLATARPLLDEALRRLCELDDESPIVVKAKLSLAMVALFEGEPARAAELSAECEAWSRARGDQWWLGHILTCSALAAEASGDVRRASTYTRQSLSAREALDDPLGVAAPLERLAWLAAADHDYQRAALLLGAADRQWRLAGQTRYGAASWLLRHQECEADTRRALGAATFDVVFHQGRGLAIEDAIGLAIGTCPEAARAGVAPAPRQRPVLSRREWEVAQLIAAGKSNKQIAAALLTAQRTAESHVESVLRKLGFANRAQVAAWAATRTDGTDGGPVS